MLAVVSWPPTRTLPDTSLTPPLVGVLAGPTFNVVMLPETWTSPAIEPPTVIVPMLPSRPVGVIGLAGSEVLSTMSLPEAVSEPPMVIDGIKLGLVSVITPLKLLPTVMVDVAKCNRLRVLLKSVTQFASRVSLIAEPPVILVRAGRFCPAATLMLNKLPVLPPEP